MKFLLTYPRSGSHWFRYVSEFVTGKPTHDPNRKKRSILVERNLRTSF